MRYFNVTQAEIDKKLFNIFVGISLGNKLLTPALAKRYVKWAHAHTKDNALIFIADTIDIVNWQVFCGLDEQAAHKKVRQKARGLADMFEKTKKTLCREERDPTYLSHVHLVFWDDVCIGQCQHLRDMLAAQYQTNPAFCERVLYFVDQYVALRKKPVSDENKKKLATYIINELPTLLSGISWNNTLYDLILYPTYVDSGMSQFVLDIYAGKYFDARKLHLNRPCGLAEDFLQSAHFFQQTSACFGVICFKSLV